MRMMMAPVTGILGMTMLATAAGATPATVTVTGTVLNGYDAAGTFGAAGASLARLPFSAIFTVDQTNGNTVIAAPGLSYLYGAGAGAAAPVGAALTVGSGSHAFAGTRSGSARALDRAGDGGTDALHYMVEDAGSAAMPSGALFYVSIDSLRDLLSRADYANYGTIALTTADNAKGYTQIGGAGGTTYAELSLNTISAHMGAAVPEPATWMMMVAGFALAGTALRRARVSGRVRFA